MVPPSVELEQLVDCAVDLVIVQGADDPLPGVDDGVDQDAVERGKRRMAGHFVPGWLTVSFTTRL